MKNLAALEIFVTVGKLRNFSRAAEQLGLTKSTVSRQIQSLERDLGVSLIKRDPRHFSLTDEGSAFLKRAEPIIDQTMEAFDEVSSIHSGIKGTIRISTTVDLSLFYLTKSVAEFSIENPGVEFLIDLSPGLVDLKTDGFDMAVRAGRLKDSTLYARKLNEHQPGFFATPEYLERMGRPKNISDLIKHTLVATGKMNVDGSSISPTIAANNMSVVKQLTLKGAGIGLLSDIVVKEEKKAGSLIQILPSLVLPKVPIYLLFPQKKMPKRIAVFAQKIFDSRI
jgi:DNA-binding transcriptional LysR family regulator